MYLYLFVGLALYRGLITWKFYTAAGRKAYEAFIPFYNTWVLLQITERPKWWIAIYYVPVVDNIMAIILTYELLHMFKFRKVMYTILSVATLGLYLGYLNYTQELKYAERDDNWIKKNLGSTVNAILFAIVAATLIRSTTFESYTIPTGSMEETLLIGDFLFVSKMHYGVRLPITPLTVPLVHNIMPVIGGKSYSDIIQLPYVRLPKLQPIERTNPVVFNWPADPDDEAIDKRDNYVKRCVAVPGDTFAMEAGTLLVMGKELSLPDRSRLQHSYIVTFNRNQMPSTDVFKEQFDIDLVDPREIHDVRSNWKGNQIELIIPDDKIEAFRQLPAVVSAERIVNTTIETIPAKDMPHGYAENFYKYFYNSPEIVEDLGAFMSYPVDQMGPFFIPNEGSTIQLTPENYRMYRHAIVGLEGHELRYTNGQFILDGEVATEYTFEQDYYFMVGDNRHNSFDSRGWGLVPESHIVGKPVFIWMSYDRYGKKFADRIRTERVFTTVNGSGKRVSYFLPFVGVVVAYSLFQRFRRKKKGDK